MGATDGNATNGASTTAVLRVAGRIPGVPGSEVTAAEDAAMADAIALAATARREARPNPWVGAVVVSRDGTRFSGWTAPPGGSHAEVSALSAAGGLARGGTLVTTLEPCSHHGRTPPCTDAIIAAGINRVVIGTIDPDTNVSGSGVAALRAAGVDVAVGARAAEIEGQLAPYLKHRRTGRPWVVLKLAATLDGRTAAPDGTSRWITGDAARRDAHALRAESDAVLVGAGTARADDPELTVRVGAGDPGGRQPLRVVLGEAPPEARARPLLELGGDLGAVLDELGERGVLQLLVEGGPRVAHAFHAAGLVDRYVVYLAPAFAGGSDGRPLFDGRGVSSIANLWRGRILDVRQVGDDLRVELGPAGAGEPVRPEAP